MGEVEERNGKKRTIRGYVAGISDGLFLSFSLVLLYPEGRGPSTHLRIFVVRAAMLNRVD